MLFSTLFFSILLWIFQHQFGEAIGLQDFPSIIQISIFIIALDALTTIPFAKLRQEQRPKKFAFIKIAGVVFNIIVTWFYIAWCPKHVDVHANSFLNIIYDTNENV